MTLDTTSLGIVHSLIQSHISASSETVKFISSPTVRPCTLIDPESCSDNSISPSKTLGMLYEQQEEADAFQWAWTESHVTLPDCVLFTVCQSSFIHHRKRYLLPGERWWWHKMSKQEGYSWMHTFHSAWFWHMTWRQQQKERGKKAKFSKPTKKMGEELAAKKRERQQNFGSSEIEYQKAKIYPGS